MTVAGAAAACLVWTLFTTGALVVSAFSGASQDAVAVRTQAYYERLIADRQARLNSVVARLTTSTGSLDGLARAVTERHAALAMLLTDLHGAPGAAMALAPIKAQTLDSRSPVDQIRSVESDQERLVLAAEGYAHNRAERLKLAFHLAGLDPSSYSGRGDPGAMGGPLIEAKDPRALAAVLDVDEGFAERIQHAARDLNAMKAMSQAVEKLPLSQPLTDPVKTSPFGVRVDPFTHHGAFHPGQDFAGAFMTPVHSTAPGVVSSPANARVTGMWLRSITAGGLRPAMRTWRLSPSEPVKRSLWANVSGLWAQPVGRPAFTYTTKSGKMAAFKIRRVF